MMLALALEHLKRGTALCFLTLNRGFIMWSSMRNRFSVQVDLFDFSLVNRTFSCFLWERDRERKGIWKRLILWHTQPGQKPFCTCCTSTHAGNVLGGKWSRKFYFTLHLVKILLTFRWKPEQNQCFSQLNTLVEGLNYNLLFIWSNKEVFPFLNSTKLGQVLPEWPTSVSLKYLNVEHVPSADHRGVFLDQCYSTYTLPVSHSLCNILILKRYADNAVRILIY